MYTITWRNGRKRNDFGKRENQGDSDGPLVSVETILITTNTSGVHLWVLDNPRASNVQELLRNNTNNKKT